MIDPISYKFNNVTMSIFDAFVRLNIAAVKENKLKDGLINAPSE